MAAFHYFVNRFPPVGGGISYEFSWLRPSPCSVTGNMEILIFSSEGFGTHRECCN
jgi:hypothetical protein